MYKSITAIVLAAALLLGLGIFEWRLLDGEFHRFSEEVETLYEKTELQTASEEDARAVLSAWEAHKEKLHVWIPHNDIIRIDDYLAEAVRLLGEGNFPLALARLEIVRHLSGCLPATYRPALENIF